ncbi:LOW QUALITY PROTEIN: auxin response factor 13-like [Oryza brachyantha]|uniref:LOW QUALITY PROTEIN: auxin response factor 13-like n=1 Tax=Oryza brachyantha TaxID=4533 RepID=UPI001AD9D629|nr:LOW QUALITY PROTEIN: auxin response factor 13-like [Oryza brachyantha]
MALPPAASPPPPPTPVDPIVWLACASPLSRLPVVGSQVYYFPAGHAQQCPTPLPLPAHPLFLCSLTALSLSADPTTGEPYATISLLPLRPGTPPAAPAQDQPLPAVSLPAPGVGSQRQPPVFCYYPKQLTQSDANNGGGFSVPRLCAESIFPPLDFDDDPPVQILNMTDLQGKSWEFRHIFRGTPRRHLLTTGWSKFVNAKVLVAGDTVVFMRRPDLKLLVGVRRAPRFDADSRCNARARVPAQEIMEAVRLASNDEPFTVTYYPRQGAGEFVVPRMEVEKGLTSAFMPGMQVRIQIMESEDTRRTAWLNGTINKVYYQQMWNGLEVDWDSSAASFFRTDRCVNPWQVQPVGFPPLPSGVNINPNTISSAPICTEDSLLVPSPMLPPQPPVSIQGARHNNPNAHADIPSSSTSVLTTQALFPTGLQNSVPPSLGGGSSSMVNPQNGSPSNNPVNTPPSDLPDGMKTIQLCIPEKTIQLFGVKITSPVQSDTNGGFSSAQVNQVPEGMDDETSAQEATDTTPTGSPTNGHNNQDAARL